MSSREKALLDDDDHRRYSRAKRHKGGLPDGWDDTKIIKRQKSWKWRKKDRRQWESEE